MKERPILFSTSMVQAIIDGRKTQTRRIIKGFPLEAIHFSVGSDQDSEIMHSELPITDDLFYEWVNGELRFSSSDYPEEGYVSVSCPFGQVGDRLWVRETWQIIGDPATLPCQSHNLIYKADYPNCVDKRYDTIPDISEVKFKPSIHMPRWASRIQLEITNIRIERLSDISEQDAIAEGVEPVIVPDNVPVGNGWAKENRNMWKGYKNNARAYRDTAKDSFNSLWESINGDGSWAVNPWVWIVEFKVIQGGEA